MAFETWSTLRIQFNSLVDTMYYLVVFVYLKLHNIIKIIGLV